MPSIYLDHNSTTPMLPEVAAAMAECYAAGYANPASQHAEGRRARRRLEEARDEVARILGADVTGQSPDRVIFTSGGTEANNLAIDGIWWTRMQKANELPVPYSGWDIVISPLEHPSVTGPADRLKAARLEADSTGVVQLNSLKERINRGALLVSVMLGNNETGVLQPISALAAICAEKHVPLHTDASQVAGKLPIDFRELGVAAMTVAAHKFHGPLGIGALIVRGDVELAPQLYGGFQQESLRPGTESVALAVGMATALQIFEREKLERAERMRVLRDRLEALVLEAYPRAIINGFNAPRLPGTSNIAFVGLDRQELLVALDLAGVCCSTGSACASGSSEPSPVLLAMGLPPEIVNSSLRFSLGAMTTEKEIDAAAATIADVCRRLVEKRQP